MWQLLSSSSTRTPPGSSICARASASLRARSSRAVMLLCRKSGLTSKRLRPPLRVGVPAASGLLTTGLAKRDALVEIERLEAEAQRLHRPRHDLLDHFLRCGRSACRSGAAAALARAREALRDTRVAGLGLGLG
eukprot:2961774-Pleurochrysis_carterae.AAC.1